MNSSRLVLSFLAIFTVMVLALTGCTTSDPGGDGKLDELAPGGKADGLYGECEVDQVLGYVNDMSTDVDVLKADGVHTRAAKNIIIYRNGLDQIPGTEDDDFFETIEELDGVYYVGPKAMEQLVAAIKQRCMQTSSVSVIFSPQEYDQSHLVRAAELIDGAQNTIDIAMYSFSDYGIRDSLQAAANRGVKIRFIFEKANSDRKDPEGTWSAKLEDMGINVRYINKIMHHKFAIIDGPYDSLDQATTGTLITGSGNWSNSAGTRYDENTVIIQGNGELMARFQMEFNHVWENSRDFIWDDSLEWIWSKEISEPMIVDDPYIDAKFTSANFRTYEGSYGPTFSVIRGENEVADKLIELIQASTKSIHIASGHLRSRPVSEALLAKAAQNPDMDIRVYLDNQEYISEWYNDEQERDLLICLDEAGTSEAQTQDCYDKGFYFSYPLYSAGVQLRFKYYCYRWHYSYAKQMHHKYLIFDSQIVASGSYNLSDNAEHNTIENMVIYDAAKFQDLVAAFEANFESLWITGEDEGLYGQLMDEIENGTDSFPIVFDSMALTWEQVTDLKNVIRENCPDINSYEYRTEPQSHTWCDR